jgi:hypothetical protein
MRVHQEELQHPTQAGLVRLNVYEVPPPSPVYGMDAPATRGQYLVTEDRVGTATVVSTIGIFASRDEAVARVHVRAEALKAQHYAPLAEDA